MTAPTLEAPPSLRLGLHLGIAALVVSGSAGVVYVPSSCEWSCAAISSSADASQSTYRFDTSTGQGELFVHGDFARADNAELLPISELRDLSGLTASQVARLFGVSRRSVNNWIAGKQMAPQHEERLSQLLTVMRGLDGSNPEERRSALLDSSTGTSIFHQLAGQAPRPTDLQANPLMPSEQF